MHPFVEAAALSSVVVADNWVIDASATLHQDGEYTLRLSKEMQFLSLSGWS